MRDPLFTPRFFIMCAYSFTVFVSVFQLLPTAPYHVVELGRHRGRGGPVSRLPDLCVGASRLRSRGRLATAGAAARVHRGQPVLALFTASYALIRDYRWLLVVVTAHGLFWSGLLAASGAYMTATIPRSRRAEGLGYWGLTSISRSRSRRPWVSGSTSRVVFLCIEMTVLNLLMAVIAWRLPDDHSGALGRDPADEARPHTATSSSGACSCCRSRLP